MRWRIFAREPAAIFWTYAFPLLLALALGIAFRNRPPEQPTARRGKPRPLPMANVEYGFETRAIHAGATPDPTTGARALRSPSAIRSLAAVSATTGREMRRDTR